MSEEVKSESEVYRLKILQSKGLLNEARDRLKMARASLKGWEDRVIFLERSVLVAERWLEEAIEAESEAKEG